MSGKSAKKVRKVLGVIKFPILNEEHTGRIRAETKPGYVPPTYTVEADHARRITKLANQRRISIQEATQVYIKKMGMGPKPSEETR